jgi:hypothetical protein
VVRHRTRRPATDLLVNRPLAVSQAGELRNREVTPSEYTTQVAAAVLNRQQHRFHTHNGDPNERRRRINHLCLPPEVDTDVIEDIEREVRRLLASEGLRAFEMLRSAAIAHEAGHAIVGRHEGLAIVQVEVFKCSGPQGEVWGGATNENAPWRIDATTPTAGVLARVRYMVAGIAGEAILDPEGYRRGSSLDEIVLSQLICVRVLQERSSEFVGVDHPHEIWSGCWRQTCVILKRNEDIARDLMRKLARTGCLRGKPLAASLRRVRS